MRFSYLVSKKNFYLQIGKRNLELCSLVLWLLLELVLALFICTFLFFVIKGDIIYYLKTWEIIIGGFTIFGLWLLLFLCRVINQEIEEEDYQKIYERLNRILKKSSYYRSIEEVIGFMQNCLNRKGFLDRDDYNICYKALDKIESDFNQIKSEETKKNWKEKLVNLHGGNSSITPQ